MPSITLLLAWYSGHASQPSTRLARGHTDTARTWQATAIAHLSKLTLLAHMQSLGSGQASPSPRTVLKSARFGQRTVMIEARTTWTMTWTTRHRVPGTEPSRADHGRHVEAILAWRRQQWAQVRYVLKRDCMGREQGVVEIVDSMWLTSSSRRGYMQTSGGSSRDLKTPNSVVKPPIDFPSRHGKHGSTTKSASSSAHRTLRSPLQQNSQCAAKEKQSHRETWHLHSTWPKPGELQIVVKREITGLTCGYLLAASGEG